MNNLFAATCLSAAGGLLIGLCTLRAKHLYFTVTLDFLSVGSVPLELLLVVDSWSTVFASTVLGITAAVLWFSGNYMAGEKHYLRFHLLVLSFVGSMLLLIFSPSLIALLMGWDGLGITSYLLVIYFCSHKSLNAGLITALTNRIGDCLILLGLAVASSSVSWSAYFREDYSWAAATGGLGLLLVCAAFTKSAQVPFSAWLPAAMAAPTPVSSLVHSSTLVTAGVYLMCRFSETLGESLVKWLILPFGVATMLLAGVSALFETDMKKIVALSTLSQLGLMMSALGVSLSTVAIFHLLTHAYFKALLFMTVGNLIHLTDSFQDSRKTGSEPAIVTPTLIFSLVANFSLMGLPFMAGFYSKDLIMEAPSVSGYPVGVSVPFFVATALTAAYTVRFLVSIVAGKSRSPKALWAEDLARDLPLGNSVLAPLAVAGGSLLAWTMLELPSVNVIPHSVKNLTSLSILSGTVAGLAWLNKNSAKKLSSISWSWGVMWGLPFSSTAAPLLGALPSSSQLRQFDLSWVVGGLLSLPTSLATPVPAFITSRGGLPLEVGMVIFLLLLLLLW